MPSQIIKQPDGKFAVFSTIVDGFVLVDATPEEIIESEVEAYKQRITEQVTATCKKLDAGEKPKHHMALTYEQAVAIHTERHGEL